MMVFSRLNEMEKDERGEVFEGDEGSVEEQMKGWEMKRRRKEERKWPRGDYI